jgi:itaconate CoA-transferase
VSVCDIAAGMNAYEAILEAVIARERSGEGATLSVAMFDAMADWMTVPLLQYEGGMVPRRMGLAHTSIAPYGVFKTNDGADILISIQSDREWRVLAGQVLEDKALAQDKDFATNVRRVERRQETDARVACVFAATDEATLTEKLLAADIAFARVNDTALLARHPHFRRIDVASRRAGYHIRLRRRATKALRVATAGCQRSASTPPAFAPSSCRNAQGDGRKTGRYFPSTMNRCQRQSCKEK